jgi:predicted ArsR family transcriptional regulator
MEDDPLHAGTSKVVVTEQQLIAALQRAAEIPNGEGYMTTADLCDALGLHENTVRRRLHKLKKDGRLETGRVRVKDLCDRSTMVPAYRLRET